MNNKIKYIGVESRIHFEIIENAIHDYIQEGVIDKEKCLNHIKQFTKGENRSNKILKHISVLIKKNEKFLKELRIKLKGENYFQLPIQERKAFILSIFCLAFPITYDILTSLAIGFKVQDKLNTKYIMQKIGAIYGGNRAMNIAVTEIIPLLIDCGSIKRIKVGLYNIGIKLKINTKFISEVIIYTDIKLSGSKTILLDDLGFKPWFSFFDISTLNSEEYGNLISKRESAVGKGYLMIKN